MKSYLKRLLSLLIVATILFSALSIPISATSFVTGANSVSDLYKSSEYYEKLTSLKLTGDGRADVIAVALSQLGYTEGDEKNDFSGTAGGTQNYTEYNYNMGSFGSGYGGVDYPWCASFVSFCLLQAGVHSQTKVADWCRKHEGDPQYIYREVSCRNWAKQLRTCGYFKDSVEFGGDYLPIPGDLIYFTENGISESHIGIVLYSDGTRVYTVEGNTNALSGIESNGDGVYVKSYPLTSSYIRGYGVLPYKVNNLIPRIDYSGEAAGRGTYVSTVTKYVYLSESASTYDYLLPKNSFFTVTDVCANGRLKVICEIGGKTIEGYVKNNSDRVIQIASSDSIEGYPSIESAWGYRSSRVDCYVCGTEKLTEKRELSLLVGESLGICGSADLSREISSFGYYFDSDVNRVFWDDDAATKREAGAVFYEIEASVSGIATGNHTVHFVTGLSDGTVTEIDSLSFLAKSKNQTVPQAPKVLAFDDTSVTLLPTDGYEYKLFDGEWQPSNVFSELVVTGDEPLLFYQRKAETDTDLPSNTSPAATVYFKAMNDESKLDGLMLDASTPLPSFDPDVFTYDVTVPSFVSELSPVTLAKDGAKVTVDAPSLVAGEVTEIKISVECKFGRVREYIIRVSREASESEIVTETLPVPVSTDIITQEVVSTEAISEEKTNVETYDKTEEKQEEISCTSLSGIVPITLFAVLGCLFVKKKHK